MKATNENLIILSLKLIVLVFYRSATLISLKENENNKRIVKTISFKTFMIENSVSPDSL